MGINRRILKPFNFAATLQENVYNNYFAAANGNNFAANTLQQPLCRPCCRFQNEVAPTWLQQLFI